MTHQELSQLVGHPKAKKYIDALNATFDKYEINTPLRQAHFLAQVLHETGGLNWMQELWGPTETQKRYEGRADLGNTEPGDGYRYRGRGAIQLTGRHNYAMYSEHAGVDFITYPELVEEPEHAIDVAGWYWDTRNLNALADDDDIEAVTRRVNGGLNGLAGRITWFNEAKQVLS